ncbi:FecR domain-containing protein [uncultured Cyclobacterium sp.]|uniref:FecR family protein n=1 Tax=uncultured Cyclobacterium sp. TaxID=453820 RepID=UPI0030ECD367
MEKKKFIRLLQKQSKGEASPHEVDQIKHVFDLLQNRKIEWSLSANQEKELKIRIKQKIDLNKKEVKVPFKLATVLKWAAILTLGCSLTYLLFSSINEKSHNLEWVEKVTSESEKRKVTFPDGSVVYMNTNSKVRFPLRFEEGVREVHFEGEGFFEVKKDKQNRFEVYSNGVITRVLGTTFNISAIDNDQVEVTVASGKVEVSEDSPGNLNFSAIEPNQKATINKGDKEIKVENIDLDKVLAWRAEQMFFDLLPFDQVVEAIGKMYHVDFEIKGENKDFCLVRASYSNDNLFSILYGLKNIVDFEWKKASDRKIIIAYKGCIN